VYLYGKTRQEAAEKMTKVLNDVRQGIFTDPGKLTAGEWLDTWLWEYKKKTASVSPPGTVMKLWCVAT